MLSPAITSTGYHFRYGFVVCIVLGYEFRSHMGFVICFMYWFRIRVQETRKPCYLLFVLFQDTNSGGS